MSRFEDLGQEVWAMIEQVKRSECEGNHPQQAVDLIIASTKSGFEMGWNSAGEAIRDHGIEVEDKSPPVTSNKSTWKAKSRQHNQMSRVTKYITFGITLSKTLRFLLVPGIVVMAVLLGLRAADKITCPLWVASIPLWGPSALVASCFAVLITLFFVFGAFRKIIKT